MKNYPEYPDDEDVYIKDIGELYGEDDWQRCKIVWEACKDLQLYSIQSPRLVARMINIKLAGVLRKV